MVQQKHQCCAGGLTLMVRMSLIPDSRRNSGSTKDMPWDSRRLLCAKSFKEKSETDD
jgi:hypothetical protein